MHQDTKSARLIAVCKRTLTASFSIIYNVIPIERAMHDQNHVMQFQHQTGPIF